MSERRFGSGGSSQADAQWQRERFAYLQSFFTDEEIRQAKLFKVPKGNRGMQKFVANRQREIRRHMRAGLTRDQAKRKIAEALRRKLRNMGKDLRLKDLLEDSP